MENWEYRKATDLHLPWNKRFQSVRREHGLIGAASCTLRWAFVRSYLRLMHRPQVEGREHIPHQSPFILVGNHTSHLDALVAAAVLPASMNHRLFPIAAGDTFSNHQTTALLSGMFLNVLPMARDGSGGSALLTLRERLQKEECGLLLFPEGTRSRSGELGRFKAGVGMLVAGTSVPVIPYHITGAYEAWPPNKRLPRPYPITIRFGPPQTFAAIENHRPGWKQVAEILAEAVQNLGTTATL